MRQQETVTRRRKLNFPNIGVGAAAVGTKEEEEVEASQDPEVGGEVEAEASQDQVGKHADGESFRDRSRGQLVRVPGRGPDRGGSQKVTVQDLDQEEAQDRDRRTPVEDQPRTE